MAHDIDSCEVPACAECDFDLQVKRLEKDRGERFIKEVVPLIHVLADRWNEGETDEGAIESIVDVFRRCGYDREWSVNENREG